MGFLRRMDEQSGQKGRKTVWADNHTWTPGETDTLRRSLVTCFRLATRSWNTGPLRPVSHTDQYGLSFLPPAVTHHNKHFKWFFVELLYCTCVLVLPYLLTLMMLVVIKYISSWNSRATSTLNQDRGERQCNFSKYG